MVDGLIVGLLPAQHYGKAISVGDVGRMGVRERDIRRLSKPDRGGARMPRSCYSAIPAALLVFALSGCGVQQLKQGEPDFNTGVLLPGYSTSDTSAAARDPTACALNPNAAGGE
jgi:hypothetical protein